MGDEVYGIAMVWYATKLIGLNAGYISAVQAGSVFVFSVLGGIWADHRDHRAVMITADLVRGFIVLSLPVIGYFQELSLWVLIPVAVVVSSLNAFFQPAMSAFLPQLIEDRALLQVCSGLMETTSRLARVVGPGLVGLLSRFIPLVHYFTLDAISFFASAASIAAVKATGTAPPPRLAWHESLRAGQRLVAAHGVMAYVIYSGCLVGAAWMFILPLGLTLLLRERLPADVGALGFLISAYGVGNLSANLVVSGFSLHRPERWMFTGRLFGGIGFALLCFSHQLPAMMFACALAAVGGPLADLGFVSLVQRHYRGADVARVFRYAMALSNACLLLVFAISPWLFSLASVPAVIGACAAIIFLLGLLGFAR